MLPKIAKFYFFIIEIVNKHSITNDISSFHQYKKTNEDGDFGAILYAS